MKQLRQLNINQILFLDIETAPMYEHFSQAPENVKKEWIYKMKFRTDAPAELTPETLENANYNPEAPFFKRQEEAREKYFSDLWEKQAALYAEFSRIVCISVGFVSTTAVFKMKSYFSLTESEILNAFAADLEIFEKAFPLLKLCAHHGKGFDFPFLAKRFLFHKKQIPNILDTFGLKPWEMVSLLDTREIWKFGSGDSAGLPAIALHFGLPTPKDDLDGSQVKKAFFAGELNRISQYCEKDVFVLFNVFKCMRLEEPYTDSQIEINL